LILAALIGLVFSKGSTVGSIGSHLGSSGSMSMGSSGMGNGGESITTIVEKLVAKERSYAVNTTALTDAGDQKLDLNGESSDSDKMSISAQCVNTSSSSSSDFGLSLDYFTNKKNTTADVSFAFKLCGIVEYFESGATEGYQSGEDTFIQRHFSDSWGHWKDVTPDGADYTKYRAISIDEIFSIAFYYTTTNATLPNGVYIDSNTFKVDINITNFEHWKNGSHMALCAFLDTTAEVMAMKNESSSGDADKFSVGGTGDLQGYLNWVSYVDTEAGEIGVIAAYNSSAGRIYYTLNDTAHHKKIMWDPSIGIESAVTYSSTSTGSGSTGNAASAVFISLMSLFIAFFGFLIQ